MIGLRVALTAHLLGLGMGVATVVGLVPAVVKLMQVLR